MRGRALGPMRALRGVGLAALLLALALKALVPTGWMPGTSLSQPIVLCPDYDAGHPMPAMRMARGEHHDHHGEHGAPDHPCAFAGLGAPTLAALIDPPVPLPAGSRDGGALSRPEAASPGRGLAAPPPPSHAPPLQA